MVFPHSWLIMTENIGPQSNTINYPNQSKVLGNNLSDEDDFFLHILW